MTNTKQCKAQTIQTHICTINFETVLKETNGKKFLFLKLGQTDNKGFPCAVIKWKQNKICQ